MGLNATRDGPTGDELFQKFCPDEPELSTPISFEECEVNRTCK